FDAAAIKFNWDRMKDPTFGAQARAVLVNVTDETVIDPQTLQISLNKANFTFPSLFGFYNLNWIGSPTAIQASGADFGTKPVGAGPFMLQSRQVGTQTVMVRNPNYWNKPLPYLDQLTIKINPDNNQNVDTVTAG